MPPEELRRISFSDGLERVVEYLASHAKYMPIDKILGEINADRSPDEQRVSPRLLASWLNILSGQYRVVRHTLRDRGYRYVPEHCRPWVRDTMCKAWERIKDRFSFPVWDDWDGHDPFRPNKKLVVNAKVHELARRADLWLAFDTTPEHGEQVFVYRDDDKLIGFSKVDQLTNYLQGYLAGTKWAGRPT